MSISSLVKAIQQSVAISSNKLTIKKNRISTRHITPIGSKDHPLQNKTKTDDIPEPAPYTFVQTYAAMLRHNHSKSENHVKLIAPVITTKQGLPDVLCSKEEVLGPLADACNYTLIRKFTNTMPEMEVL